jgi:hypothetical protein
MKHGHLTAPQTTTEFAICTSPDSNEPLEVVTKSVESISTEENRKQLTRKETGYVTGSSTKYRQRPEPGTGSTTANPQGQALALRRLDIFFDFAGKRSHYFAIASKRS